MKRRSLFAASLALSSLTLGMPLASASTGHYPDKPITMVVSFPAGGIADTVARAVSRSMSIELGQPVVVSNRPGGGGQIAATALVQAPADGYTILVAATDLLAINQTLYSKLSYDPENDFAAVSSLVSSPLILVLPGNSPIGSVDELVARAKQGGGLNFASQGVGSIGHLLGEQLKQSTAGTYNHVPYRGSAPALQDLVGGHQVDFMFDPILTTEPFVKSGQLKPLAIAAAQRAPQVPNLPTMAELGFNGLDLGVWFGVVAKAGTPQLIIDKLNAAIQVALADPQVVERFNAQGMLAFPSSAQEFSTFIASEQKRWAPLVKASGATVN